MDFAKFDKLIDQKALQKEVKEAANMMSDVPKGSYTVGIDKMELKATKDGRPMFFIQARISEGDHKNKCLFMNRVIYGTKNDANMISSVVTILDKFQTETVPEFVSYTQFADLIADIYEEVQGNVLCDIDYDPDAFNSISITDVYDA